ncbi:hypothetical protein CTA1_10929 [Colletotrichum tanaceti]|uniref:Uncharacterized protein n=1 Tax=Colletotrichum tanaceti TaxID=1306861 RepID=A0A4U6XKA6_9PEZI|nr:hypothetical protein CTA1_10929 [Colletotrichum tanaceti]
MKRPLATSSASSAHPLTASPAAAHAPEFISRRSVSTCPMGKLNRFSASGVGVNAAAFYTTARVALPKCFRACAKVSRTCATSDRSTRMPEVARIRVQSGVQSGEATGDDGDRVLARRGEVGGDVGADVVTGLED